MTQIKNRLKKILEPYTFVLVCLSGGLDSALLLKVVYEIMGRQAQAVIFKSALQKKSRIKDAKKFANELGIMHWMIDYKPLAQESIASNSRDRCYQCKVKMFSMAHKLASGKGQGVIILDGTHLDDNPLVRPGMKANEEYGIRSPWKELGLGKEEIRCLAKNKGLSFWGMPPDSCLATRFPYDYRLTVETLGQLEAAEETLKELDLKDFRLRPADSPPQLFCSDEDYHMAGRIGFNRIRDILSDKTSWHLKNMHIRRKE